MNCDKCGKHIPGKIYPGNTCQACYHYFLRGGIVHPLPAPGTVETDDRGFVICHICGRSYKRLGSHAKESHGLTIHEYKLAFGLCENARTTEAGYSDTMRELAYKYDMPEQLRTTGRGTRIKPGETDKRKGKQTRLQESLQKKARRKSA